MTMRNGSNNAASATSDAVSEIDALGEGGLSRRTLMSGLGVFVLVGGGQALFGVALPRFSERFDLLSSQSGIILSAFWTGALCGVLLFMFVSHGGLQRYRIAAGVACLSLGAGLIASSLSWSVLLSGAVVFGLGYGLLTVGLNGLFAVSGGERSGVLINMLNAFFGVGAIIAPIGFVLAQNDPFRAFSLISLVSAVLLPLSFFIDDRVHPRDSGPSRAIPLVRQYSWFLLLMGLAVGIEVSAVGWGATFFVSQGMSGEEAGVYTSLFYVFFTLSRLGAIALATRFDSQSLVIGGLAVALFLFAVAALAPALSPYGYALAGGAIALAFPNVFSWLSPALKAAPQVSGLLVCAGMIGGIFSPIIIGEVIALTGTLTVFWMLSALAFVSTGIAIVLAQRVNVAGDPA